METLDSLIRMVGNGGDKQIIPVGWTSVKFDNVNNTLTMIYTSGGYPLALQNATRIQMAEFDHLGTFTKEQYDALDVSLRDADDPNLY